MKLLQMMQGLFIFLKKLLIEYYIYIKQTNIKLYGIPMQKAASRASKKAVKICQLRKRKKSSESTDFPTTTTLQKTRII